MNDHARSIENLTTILDTVGDLVAAITPEQWSASTPCPEWNVRQLVDHLVLGHRLFTGILRGAAVPTPGALDPASRDVLGDDPADAYHTATENLLTAFRQPGTLERIVQVPVGAVPGIAAVHLRAVEELVHGWDLAHATGRIVRFPDEIVHREMAFTCAKLADVPPGRSPFAPPQPAPEHATPLDRLAALLGRPISTRAGS